MNGLLYYLLQVIVASGILYGYYHFVLKNNKFHRYNRFYLLAAAVISILIPFMNIPVYFTNEEADSSLVLQTLRIISSTGFQETTVTALATDPVKTSWFTWENILYSFYFLIASLVFIKIIFSLRKIRSIINRNPVEKIGNIHFVNTDEPGTPFSFFRWLFWNRKIELKSSKGEQVFRHELFHIEQKHSLDIVFTELLSVVFWINPFFHLIKKELKAIHEFLADEFAYKENDKWEYAELLLMQVLNTKIHLTNPFFHNQIKRRIAMITLSQKPKYQYLRKLLVLPIAAIVVALFAFSYKTERTDNIIVAEKPITVVIDAAHGGNYPGAKNSDKKITEAQLTLEIAKTIESLSGEYNIKVVMTRENDQSPGGANNMEAELRNRKDIANKTNPAAFISIHLNSTNNKNDQNEFSGIEAYISSKSETENDRVLASALLQELAGVYHTNSIIKQRKEMGIYVLDRNNYPSVLLECGYIDNTKDLNFFTNKTNQEKTARAILTALVSYANNNSNKIYSNPLNNNAWSDTTRPPKVDVSNFKIPEKKSPTPAQLEKWTDAKMYGVWLDGKRINNDELGKYSPTDFSQYYVSRLTKTAKDYGKYYYDISLMTHKYYTKFEQNRDSFILRKAIWKTQGEKSMSDNEDKIFEKVDVEASFIGGEPAWRRFLEKNINANIPAKNGAPSGTYTVWVQFIVDKEGNISDIKSLTIKGYGMEEEVVRVMKKSPQWNPAIQKGNKVKAYRKQPVTFIVPKNDKTTTDKPLLKKELTLEDIKSDDNIVFDKVEKEPSFPEGEEGWRKYLQKNINANTPVDSGAKEGSYTVRVQFIVHKDGSISDLKALTHHGYGMEEEVLRVIRKGPNWEPAIQNGHRVNAYKNQTVTFVVTDGNEEDKIEDKELSKVTVTPKTSEKNIKPGN